MISYYNHSISVFEVLIFLSLERTAVVLCHVNVQP